MTYIFIPHVSKDMFVVARVAHKFTLGKISLFTLEILRVWGEPVPQGACPPNYYKICGTAIYIFKLSATMHGSYRIDL